MMKHSQNTEIYSLSNDKIEFSIHASGRILSLKNRQTDREYIAGQGSERGLFRIIYSRGASLEEELAASDCAVVFRRTEKNALQLHYSRAGLLELDVFCRLEEDELHFSARMENLSQTGDVIREFQFPLLADAKLEPSTRLYRNSVSGEFIDDIPAAIQRCHSAYIGQDNRAIESSVLYPGTAVMNMYLLEDRADGERSASTFYFASHDPSFTNTLHLMRKHVPDGSIDFTFVKYPFLKAGDRVSFPEYVWALSAGTWHAGADKYRAWAEKSWFQPLKKPQWLSKMSSWQRIIMRHQYGKIIFRHDQLNDILSDGLVCSCDTVFLFGWWREGMDAGYPAYSYDETQGGKAALKERIAAFQACGGRLILYFNGQLIDTDTAFYRERGRLISAKLPGGEREYQEFYKFGGDGTALRLFGNKTFVTACPSSEEWFELLKRHIEEAVSLGCDGVFFDQLGWTSYPCCDPSHAHEIPFMSVGAAKRRLVKRLYEYAKERNPELAFGIEWVCDQTAQYTDFVHNIAGIWDHAAENLYRYTFPEFAVSDRCIRDDSEIEARLYPAFQLGLRSDIEIYRCRASIAAAPHYRDCLSAINALRLKYASYLFDGVFRDCLGVSLSNERIVPVVYRKRVPGKQADGASLLLIAYSASPEEEFAILSLTADPLCCPHSAPSEAAFRNALLVNADFVGDASFDAAPRRLRMTEQSLAVLEFCLPED